MAAGLTSDEASTTIAAFATSGFSPSEETLGAAVRVVYDSIAVCAAALAHSASVKARAYAARYKKGFGSCAILGEDFQTDLETACLVNGALMRCHDFNDLYIGARSGGHPSDIVTGTLAAAQASGASGRDALLAVAVGYEVMLALYDLLPVEKHGFDYTNIDLIGGVCAVGRLMGLDARRLDYALRIAATSHLATDEIESGDLDSQGDLTVWKRFHGGEALRHAAMCCALATIEIEGAVRAFTGDCGFLRHLGAEPAALAALRDRLRPGRELTMIGRTTLKRWPVGSRAQSAIAAAVRLRRELGDPQRIAEAVVVTNRGSYDHLLAIREHAWRPISRETADHSLPYVVAAALADGRIDISSFDPSSISAPRILTVLAKLRVEADEDAWPKNQQAALGFPTRIRVRTTDGAELLVDGGAPPGHPSNPLQRADLEDKMREGLAAVGWSERFDDLSRSIWGLAQSTDPSRVLTLLCARPHET